MAAAKSATVAKASTRSPCCITGATKTARPEKPTNRERANKKEGRLRSRIDSIITGHMGVVPITKAAKPESAWRSAQTTKPFPPTHNRSPETIKTRSSGPDGRRWCRNAKAMANRIAEAHSVRLAAMAKGGKPLPSWTVNRMKR